jgi:hypothetical protein
VACPLLLRWLRMKATRNSKMADVYKAFLLRWAKWKDSVTVVAKQLFGFFQVVVLLRSVYRIPFPSLYIEVLDWFAFANLDFVFILRMECFLETNWHTRVYAMGFVCFGCLVGTAMMHPSCTLKTSAQQQTKPVRGIIARWVERVGNILLVLGYFIYAAANTIFFQTFNCLKVDSTSFLRNDLSIDCSDPTHKSATTVAALMVILFSIGLPVMYLLLLFPHRKGFAGQSGRSQVALSDVKILRFFYLDYKPKYFYWEVLECLRKLLLTGVAVTILPGSLIQSVLSLGVIVVYAVAVAHFKPYRIARDNALALVLYSMLAVTLFIGLLLKVKDGYENSGKYEDGFSAASMTCVLVGTIVGVLVAGIGAVVYDTRRVLREPLLQHKEGRSIVALPPLGGASFDLFLSHAQDLGQDQVATIKGMLEKLLPSIQVFLVSPSTKRSTPFYRTYL